MVVHLLCLDSYRRMYQLPVSTIEGEIKVPPHIRIHLSYVWCVKTAAIQGKLPLRLFSPPRIKAAGSSTSNILGDMPHSVTVIAYKLVTPSRNIRMLRVRVDFRSRCASSCSSNLLDRTYKYQYFYALLVDFAR